MYNIYDLSETQKIILRINKIVAQQRPVWGKMSATQVMAHLNVPYEMVFENKHKKPPALVRFLLRSFLKSSIVNEVPYKPNLRTAPAFLIKDERNFDLEKNRLIAFINKTQQLGSTWFEDRESLSFGKLNAKEWNNLFAKHLDHHLKQFGV